MKKAPISIATSLNGYRVYGTALIETWDGVTGTIEMETRYVDNPEDFEDCINDNGFGAMRILAAMVHIDAVYTSKSTFASGALYVLYDNFFWDPIKNVRLNEDSKFAKMLMGMEELKNV